MGAVGGGSRKSVREMSTASRGMHALAVIIQYISDLSLDGGVTQERGSVSKPNHGSSYRLIKLSEAAK